MHMNIIERRPHYRMWLLAATLGALAAGCNKDPILGVNGIAALVPAVTAVTPLGGATGVSTSNPQITATLNEPIAPIAGTASMTVTCASPCVDATGIVTLDATNTIATLTLTCDTALTSSTVYTVASGGPACRAVVVAMLSPYSWKFTTVASPADLTSPRVSTTSPAT